MNDTLEFRTMMVCSTGHISYETSQLLDQEKNDKVMCGPFGEVGWICWVHEEQNKGTPYEIPDDLWAVMVFARANGATYILFDCDGPLYPALAEYDWGEEIKLKEVVNG